MKISRNDRRLDRAIPAAGILLLTGIAAVADTPLPVVARMQVLYSVVGHYSSIADRVNFYNTLRGVE